MKGWTVALSESAGGKGAVANKFKRLRSGLICAARKRVLCSAKVETQYVQVPAMFEVLE